MSQLLSLLDARIPGHRQFLSDVVAMGLLPTPITIIPDCGETAYHVCTVQEYKVVSHANGSCVICLEHFDQEECKSLIVKWSVCGHIFHQSCLETWLRTHKNCPTCRTPQQELRGFQPEHGVMYTTESPQGLPGYDPQTQRIIIHFCFPQTPEIQCYLPQNQEGQRMVRLLRKAFQQKLLFKVDEQNVLCFNGIELKLNVNGGPLMFGFPDETYLIRLRMDLARLGIK